VSQIEAEGAKAATVASKIQGEIDSSGQLAPADMALRASPSVLFDAVVILAGPDGDKKLASDPNALSFLIDAKRHCKAVGFAGIPSLAKKAGVAEEAGILDLSGKTGVKGFIAGARTGRFWEREIEQ
jgi:catalase